MYVHVCWQRVQPLTMDLDLQIACAISHVILLVKVVRAVSATLAMEHEEDEVEVIIADRHKGNSKEYLVRFATYGP